MGATVTDISGIGPSAAETLRKSGYGTLRQIADTSVEKLGAVHGFGEIRATRIINRANELLRSSQTDAPSASRTRPRTQQKMAGKVDLATGSETEKQLLEKLRKEKAKKEKAKKEKAKKEKAKKEKAKKEKAKKEKAKKEKAKKEKAKKEKAKKEKAKKEKAKKKKN
jgi:creatinine amidohydrolase/Fe(II)-dependent formamide hydrolase-like protein